uniref:Putative secreted protein n=1 Tax=Rhodnius neglectus TaxID=72488 RepID=A0A0P4VJV5_9HEMI
MSAAILILITLSQLMLTPSASILTEVINDVTLLKNELNTFMAKDGNTTARSASGKFVRPPKVVDTTIIKNKLHELQNNVTKLAEAISNKNQNVDDIKNTISSLEKQIEDLSKLFDNKDREITQTLEKFQKMLSDLFAKYINLQKEFDKLQDEEFLEAIKHRYYQLAAVKFTTMKNETSAINLVRTVYEEIGDLLTMLEFADKVDDLKRKLLIYKTIVYSSTFQHCQDCNFELFLNKLLEVFAKNEITGEQKEIFYNTFTQLDYFALMSGFELCFRRSINQYPERFKSIAEKYFLIEPLPRHYHKLDTYYSNYCYLIDSIYSILQ